jgi:hypothetical protein
MSLSIDGSGAWGHSDGGGQSSVSTSSNQNLTTSDTNDVLVAYISYANNGSQPPNSVATLTDTAGLTWTKRGYFPNGFMQISGNDSVGTTEVWWAHAPTALSGDVITATFTSGVVGCTVINVIAINGADTSAPWDTSPTLPGIATNQQLNSTTQAGSANPITTLNADCMLLAYGMNSNALSSSTTVSSDGNSTAWSAGPYVNDGGNYQLAAGIWYKSVSSAQTNLPVGSNTNNQGSNSAGTTWITDAIVAASPSPGTLTGPVIDGVSLSSWTGNEPSNPATLYLTTQGSGDLIVLMIGHTDSSGISGVVDTAGLSWTHQTAADISVNGGTGFMQVWTAVSPSPLSNDEISVTFGGGGGVNGYSCLQAVAINNVKTSPVFDAGGSPFVYAGGSGDLAISGVSTAAANTLMLLWEYAYQGDNSSYGSPFSTEYGSSGFSPAVIGYLTAGNVQSSVYAQNFSASQSGDTYTGATSVSNTGIVAMAFAKAPPTSHGTWASTEATDTMSVHGGVLSGSWDSIGAPDVMAFSSYGGVNGSWTPTEHTDTAALIGDGPTATTFDPTTASGGIDFQSENLTVVNQGAFGEVVGAKSTSAHNSGKLYAEFNTFLANGQSGVGVGNAAATFANWGVPAGVPGPALDGAGIVQNFTIWVNGVEQTNSSPAPTNLENNIGVAIDFVNNLIWFRTNGGYWNGISGANPATATDGYDISGITGTALNLYAVLVGAEDKATLNAGATTFAYAAPSGFTAWDSIAPPAAPLQIDGYAIGQMPGGPIMTGSVTLTTTLDDDVIVLAIVMGGFSNAAVAASVTDTAGLTWHRRNQRWQRGGTKSGGTIINHGFDMEIWWAHAPTPLTADVITVVPVAPGVGAMTLEAFGVAGANYTTPWDTNSQAGGYVDTIGNISSNPAMSQLTTNAANTFLFGIHGNPDNGAAPAPWTFVSTATASEFDGDTSYQSFAYQVVEERQRATSVLFTEEYAGSPVYVSETVMFDSIVAAGETGTAGELYWYLDTATSGIIQLTTTRELVLNYTATNYNLMVLVQVTIESVSGDGEVASISEGQGLLSSAGFERRSRAVTATPAGNIATEIWWGWMPNSNVDVANNDTITINTTGTASGDIVAAQMWGLGGTTGSYGLDDPFWDGDTSLPAINSSSGASPVPNATDMSTITPSTLLVAWTANNSAPEPGYVDPFITLVYDPPYAVQPITAFFSNAPPLYMGFEYYFSQGLASNETAEFLVDPNPNGWLMIGDAIPVGPPQPPNGVWASTEARDTFSAHGFVPVQVAWHSTDHADDFTGAPQTVPFPGVGAGWLGWVKAYAAMAATETKDAMGLYGWVINHPITGQIVSHEDKDRLSFSNRSTVTGTMGAVEHKDHLSSAGFEIPLEARPPIAIKRRLLIVT